MEKLTLFIDYFLEMLNKILQAVKVIAEGEPMLNSIGEAVKEFGQDVETLKD